MLMEVSGMEVYSQNIGQLMDAIYFLSPILVWMAEEPVFITLVRWVSSELI